MFTLLGEVASIVRPNKKERDTHTPRKEEEDEEKVKSYMLKCLEYLQVVDSEVFVGFHSARSSTRIGRLSRALQIRPSNMQ